MTNSTYNVHHIYPRLIENRLTSNTCGADVKGARDVTVLTRHEATKKYLYSVVSVLSLFFFVLLILIGAHLIYEIFISYRISRFMVEKIQFTLVKGNV